MFCPRICKYYAKQKSLRSESEGLEVYRVGDELLLALIHLSFQLSQHIEITESCASGYVLDLW